MFDPRLQYKQYKFCEKQKELTDDFKAKVTLYTFPRCFQNVQIFYQFSHVSQRNVTAANPPLPTLKRTIDVSCG